MATREREPASGRGTVPQNSSALVDLDDIRELIDLIIEKGISEFELERDGIRIKIARHAGLHPAAAPSVEFTSPAGAGAAGAQAPPAGGGGQASVEAARGESALVELYVVRSPMVGTFYAAASQGAEPFVRVGDRVQAGQVLCVIEAMKLMNEIEAEAAGEVVKSYVENGQPVEYGEPLFDIRPFSPARGNRKQGAGNR